MKRSYMVIYEKVAEDNWGGWAQDIDGAVGSGDTLEQARQSLREGIGYILEDLIARGQPIPYATSTSIDFSEFDPNPEQSHYEIEWLAVDLPETALHSDDLIKQAA